MQLTVPQPKVCETYYSACSQIDRHNRCRQDDLKLERKLETKDWTFRVNTSLLAITIVYSWFLYSGAEGSRGHMSTGKFYERLATELIDNAFDRPFLRDTTRNVAAAANIDALSSSTRRSNGVGIHLMPTREKRRTTEGKLTGYAMQRKCRVCKSMKTTHICSACFASNKSAVWLCRGLKGRTCFAEHVKAVHDVDESVCAS